MNDWLVAAERVLFVLFWKINQRIHFLSARAQHRIPCDLICTELLHPVPSSDRNKPPARFFLPLLLSFFFLLPRRLLIVRAAMERQCSTQHARTHTHTWRKSGIRAAKCQQPNQRLPEITTRELKSGCAHPAEYETRGGGSWWIYGESTGSP